MNPLNGNHYGGGQFRQDAGPGSGPLSPCTTALASPLRTKLIRQNHGWVGVLARLRPVLGCYRYSPVVAVWLLPHTLFSGGRVDFNDLPSAFLR